MGYQMIYETHRRPRNEDRSLRLRTMIAVCFLVFSLIVRTMWAPGIEVLQGLFLPGDLSVTQSAFAVFLADLRSGEEVGDAFRVFCESVINEGY